MRRLVLPLLLSLSFLTPTSSSADRQDDKSAREVTIRGRAVCLDEQGRRNDCGASPTSFGFLTEDGKFFSFLKTDSATAIFTDARVRERLLQLAALLHPENQLEIIKVQSVREGKLYDLYYFCEVCNITAYAPGPCPCCQQELHLVETPAP